jgi:hypothetical protein
MHSWLRHKSITGTAVNTALAANRFKDFWGELAKALKIGRGVGVSGVGSTRDRRASERELGKLVEVAVSAGAGRHAVPASSGREARHWLRRQSRCSPTANRYGTHQPHPR